MSYTSVKSNRCASTSAMRRVIYTAFSTVALSMLGAGAYASDVGNAPAQVVSYSTKSLSQRDGAKALYVRLQRAAAQVCTTSGRTDLERMRQQRECYEQSLADAVAAVDKSSVTALYRSDKAIRVAQDNEGSRTAT